MKARCFSQFMICCVFFVFVVFFFFLVSLLLCFSIFCCADLCACCFLRDSICMILPSICFDCRVWRWLVSRAVHFGVIWGDPRQSSSSTVLFCFDFLCANQLILATKKQENKLCSSRLQRLYAVEWLLYTEKTKQQKINKKANSVNCCRSRRMVPVFFFFGVVCDRSIALFLSIHECFGYH